MPRINAYDLLGPPLDLRVFVRSISTYENATKLVVEMSLQLPTAAALVLAPSLPAFGATHDCEVHVRSGIGDSSRPDMEVSLGFQFDDEQPCIEALAAFYDHLNVMLRLNSGRQIFDSNAASDFLKTVLA